jgi:hypothetical protein
MTLDLSRKTKFRFRFLFALIFFPAVLLLPCSASAGEVSGWVKNGERSTAENYEDEDSDYGYTYRRGTQDRAI